jgi:hypothetical protein
VIFFDSQLAYEDEIMTQQIEKEMHNVKGTALRKLSLIAAHFRPEISNILVYSWFDGLPEAEKIAEHLDLNKLDLLAIQEDLKGFKEEFLRDRDKHLNY